MNQHLFEQTGPSAPSLGTRKFLSILQKLVEDGEDVSMTVAGSSMSPFLIHQRDVIYFRKPDRVLQRGDIVFYKRRSGRFVCHRIYKVTGGEYYLVGDAQTDMEGPIQREQIFALIFKVRRNGTYLNPGSFWWFFFEKIWIRIVPFRPFIVRLYSVLKKFL